MKPIKIRAFDFAEIYFKPTDQKKTKIKQLKYGDDYHPSKDHYKLLRESIESYLKGAMPKEELGNLPATVSELKENSYNQNVLGLFKWLGRKKAQWVEPKKNPKPVYGEVEISCKPEIGLKIKDKTYFIKLYLREDKLSKKQADVVLNIIKKNVLLQEGEELLVLDVRRAKAFSANKAQELSEQDIVIEAKHIQAIWESLPEKIDLAVA